MNAQFDESTGLPALASKVLDTYLIPAYGSSVPQEWLRPEPLMSWFVSRKWIDAGKAQTAYLWGHPDYGPGFENWLGDGYIAYMRQHPEAAAQAQQPVTNPVPKNPSLVVHANKTNQPATRRPTTNPNIPIHRNSTNQPSEKQAQPQNNGSGQDGYDQSGAGDGASGDGSGAGQEQESKSSNMGLIVGILTAGAALAGGVAYWLHQKKSARNPTWKYNQKDYTHYLSLRGKILSGWSYKEDAKDAKEELPSGLKDAKIYSKRYLKSIGVDPDVDSNWGNPV